MSVRKKIISAVCAAFTAALVLCGCSEKESRVSLFAMDTFMTLTVYGESGAAEDARSELLRLDRLWAVSGEESEIYKVNSSGGEPVELSAETAGLLRFSLDMNTRTGGALDITLYPLLEAWGFFGEEYRAPSESEIEALLENTGCGRISLDENTVTADGVQLDIGAVGKGYAGDIICELLRSEGVTSALLDLGGNIQAVGSKPDGSPWRVAVRSPFDDSSFAILKISDCAVVTSGGYERYFTADDGERYCHILDPQTGAPARSGIASATIVGSEGRLCDALSTAVFVMGTDRAEQLWKSLDGFDMLIVADSGDVIITEGIEDIFTLTGDVAKENVTVLRK